MSTGALWRSNTAAADQCVGSKGQKPGNMNMQLFRWKALVGTEKWKDGKDAETVMEG